MKRSKVFILCVLAAVGCAAIGQMPATEPAANPRIVYRDLTRPEPVRHPVPSPPGPAGPQASRLPAVGHRPTYFIEFANESAAGFDRSALLDFVAQTDSAAPVLVVGHSHGQSAVGTLTLAARRARAVKDWLTDRGFADVQLMAAWGRHPVRFAPSRGVHIYVLEPGDNDSVPIVFAKQIEEKSDESSNDAGQMAHRRPHAGRLGDG